MVTIGYDSVEQALEASFREREGAKRYSGELDDSFQ
jgi:hypothetical protein